VHVFSSSSGIEMAELDFYQHEWDLYPCRLGSSDGPPLDSHSTAELPPGRYVIRTPPSRSTQIPVYLTTDVPRTRAYSINSTVTAHTLHYTNYVMRVRCRDRCCCMTGQLVVGEDYTGFEAAHTFPLSETDIISLISSTNVETSH